MNNWGNRKVPPLWVICEDAGIDDPNHWHKFRRDHKGIVETMEETIAWMYKAQVLPPIKKPHALITISLGAERELDYRELPHIIQQTLTRNSSAIGQNTYIFSCEFYGSKQQFQPHVHIFVKGKGTVLPKVVRAFTRAFKDLKPNMVDVKRSDKGDLYDKRKDYVCGIKKDDKLESIKLDDEFRNKYDIKKYYDIDIV